MNHNGQGPPAGGDKGYPQGPTVQHGQPPSVPQQQHGGLHVQSQQPSPYQQQPSPYQQQPAQQQWGPHVQNQHGYPQQYAPIEAPEDLAPSRLHQIGGGIITLGTLAVVMVWMFTDSGLYYWLSELQAGADGEYYPVLSFLLAWMALLFPIMPIWLGIVSAVEGRNAFRIAWKRVMTSF